MKVLKSKRFWYFAVLGLCTFASVVLVIRSTTAPQEVVTVYKVVEPESLDSHKSRVVTEPSVIEETRHASPVEIDSGVDTWNDFFSGHEVAHTTEAITSVPDAPFAEEEPSVNAAADAPDTGVDPNAAPAAGEPDAAQQLAAIRRDLPPLLRERLHLFDLIEELAPSNGAPLELVPFREELREETRELRRAIFSRVGDYFRYSNDMSPFEPGGEFYDLLLENNMYIKRLDRIP